MKPAFRAAHDAVRAGHAPNKDYFFLGLILLAAAFLRFNGLNEPGLWLDEVSYTLAAQSPIIEQITDPDEALGELSSDPTLSAIPFSLSLMLGRSNYLARFPAALFGLFSVAFIYRIGRGLFGHMVGLVAALLLATSSFHILYSQEARNYAQFVFFSLGSFWFLFRAVSTNKVSAWSFYTLSTFGAVSTNHLMALAVPVQAIFLGLVFIREIFISNYKTVLKVGAGFLLSWVVVVLLRTPWLEDFTARRCTGCDLSGPHLAQTPELVTNWLSSIDVFSGSNSLAMPIFIIFCLLGLGFSLYYHSRAGILLACWLILSVPLTITSLWFISQFFHPRYTIWGLPAYLVAVAAGVVGVANLIARLLPISRHVSPKLPGRTGQMALASLLLLPLLLANLNQVKQQPAIKRNWPRGQLQEAANLIVSDARSGEAVIAIGMPVRYLKFYTEQSRQDLIYFDETIFVEREAAAGLPETLAGRWYILHSSYSAPHIPEKWNNSIDYRDFHDLVVIHYPASCPLKACLSDTITLLSEISEANPGSNLAKKINGVLSGLKLLLAN